MDTVGTPGKVVHPEGMIPPGVDSSRAVKWRSQDDLKIGDQQARPEKLVTPGETTRRDRWRRGRCGAGARGSRLSRRRWRRRKFDGGHMRRSGAGGAGTEFNGTQGAGGGGGGGGGSAAAAAATGGNGGAGGAFGGGGGGGGYVLSGTAGQGGKGGDGLIVISYVP